MSARKSACVVFGTCGLLLAQVQEPASRVQPQMLGRAVTDGRVTAVYLAPRYATAIRLPEAINSVVLGDPVSFSAEHSEQEPNLVFVKPTTTKPAQTNLLISTTRGHQTSLLLISRGEVKAEGQAPVDFLLRYKPAGRFLIEPADYPSALVAETATLSEARNGAAQPLAAPTPATASLDASTGSVGNGRTPLDRLLERQRRAVLPRLYGGKPDVSEPGRDLIKAGVSEVIDQGREVVVLFSVINPQRQSIELMPPQVQLGGKVRSGRVLRKSRWGTAEQFPIADYRFSRRRLGPGERADGVVIFNRPPYKQSNETLFLQVAESGAVDRPALAPIGFGISNFDFKEEASHGKPSGE